MKNIIALSILTTSVAAFAQEEDMSLYQPEKVYTHFFAPKTFWRSHKENGYSYQTAGAGFEYNLNRPQGINVSSTFITNLYGSHRLVESESSIYYKILLDKNHMIYPVLCSRSSSHRIDRSLEKDIYVNKSSLSAGIGWQYGISDEFLVRAEFHTFRDLQNALLVQETDCFWGKSYSNPTGFTGKLGLAYAFSDRIHVGLESTFSKTFKCCYQQIGLAASFKWGF